ncbi:DUF421 domain-containing protein [Jonesia quinghaiensis]|uniref:DUF421 domain-containing protein n=1 Tax=Jonesia quinghaiensis TaxID=262806 RepID=UPI0003FE4769|nr:YetF domain-containing protein [Jonesia quinghaiensis]
MWFDSWADVFRVLLVGTVTYASLIGLLRISGKRTLSQLNAFDFVITVALGSTLASILLSSDVSYVEGLTALLLLAGLQLVMAWVSTRLPGARNAITAWPTALVVDGRLQTDELRRNRLTESEVLQAIRGAGAGDTTNVAAVVLETNGKISVIQKGSLGNGSSLAGVAGFQHNNG